MSDFSKRITKLQGYLSDNALDAFLVLTEVNRQYLSGFTGSKGYLFVTKKSAALFVDGRYTIRARKESPLKVYPIEAISRKLRKGLRVGIEDEITLHQMQKLKKLKSGVVWRVTRRAVDHLRAEKTTKEISAIWKGSKIVDATFRHIVKMLKLKKALTESQIAREIEIFGEKQGADGLAFDSIVASGANAAAPHHFSSSKKKIARNNFLLLDFGFLVGGYHSDFTRTLLVGRPSKKQKKIYETVLEAQRRQIEAIAAGQAGSTIDQIGRSYIDGQGFGGKFTHCSGHGVGLEIHEAPNLCTDSEETLKKDTIITVEPGIYLEGYGGVRIEDMVLVKAGGGEVLSKIPKDLKSMIIN